MTWFQQIVVALLVTILARTYMPPLGSKSAVNVATVVVVVSGCMVWTGYAVARWAGWA